MMKGRDIHGIGKDHLIIFFISFIHIWKGQSIYLHPWLREALSLIFLTINRIRLFLSFPITCPCFTLSYLYAFDLLGMKEMTFER